MRIKKSLCICVVLVLTLTILLSSFPSYAALPDVLNIRERNFSGEKYKPSDELTFIVELEGEPVYSENRVSFFGNGESREDRELLKDMILDYQQEIVSEISNNENVDAELLDSYALLFNGFSMRGSYRSIEEIKNIPGVENVYICDDIKLITHLTDTVEMTGALPGVIAPYSGRGQVVAVIDDGFNVDHDFFKAAPSDAAYTKENVAELIKNTHTKTSADDIYKTPKIPFAYDYYYNDGGVSSPSDHGTHVAGIVGGKNGVYNGGSINGVAPDCQLLLMKVATDDAVVDVTKLILAMEDAVAMGADVINCSMGIDYASPDFADNAGIIQTMNEVFSNAYNAGVFVAASAGNMARGFNKNAPLTSNIDYSASGIPAAFSSSVSVAAVNKNYNGKMYSASSYGVGENLELKPDITAPGGNGIISSYKNGYGTMNGTSMASPHIAGAAAIVGEYLDNKNINNTANRAQFIQNLIMSTAVPTSIDSVPYSPRLQGAGVVNVEAAVTTNVILTAKDGKSKISLGDDLTESLDIKFTASNFGSESITYNKISLSVLTDSHTAKGDKYYVGAARFLEIVSHSLPSAITIEANSSAEINANIKLNSEELKAIEQIFTNGFFIDGFIRFEKSDSSVPGVGIPFTGFYGDWTKAPVYDNTVYDDDESYFINNGKYIAYETALYTWVKKDGGNDLLFLGSDGAEGFDKKYIALSPNSDGMCDNINILLTPMRSISYISSEVTNQSGNLVSKIYGDISINKFNTAALKLNDISRLPDGDYTLRLTSLYNYQKEDSTDHILELPFYVDTVLPEIIKAVPNGNVVNVTFRDNRHISYVYFCYEDKSGTVYSYGESILNPQDGGETTVSFDLSKISAQNANYNDIYIYAYDKAGNCYKNSLSCLTGDIHPEMTKFSYADKTVVVDFDLISYKSVENCKAMLAFYDNDGCLLHLNSIKDLDVKKGKNTFSFSSTANIETAVQCRLFIWNGGEDITPVDTSKSFKLTAELSN